jgi:hypothetical protein
MNGVIVSAGLIVFCLAIVTPLMWSSRRMGLPFWSADRPYSAVVPVLLAGAVIGVLLLVGSLVALLTG